MGREYQLMKLFTFISLIVVLCDSYLIKSNHLNAATKRVSASKSLRLIAQVKNFNAETLVFSRDGKLLANGGYGNIEIWDTRRWRLFRCLRHERLSSPFAFSPDGKTMTICVTHNRVQVWDIKRAKVVKTLSGFKTHVVFSSDGKLMAGWSINKGQVEEGVKIWDTRTGRRLRVLDSDIDRSDQYVFLPDNKHLMIANSGNSVAIYDLRTGEQIINQESAGSVTTPVALSRDGKMFATAEAAEKSPYDAVPEGMEVRPTTDGGVPWPYSAKLWDAHTGKLIRSFGSWESHDNPTAPIGFTSHGNQVIFNVGEKRAYNRGAYAMSFSVTTGKELRTFNIENPVVMSPDGKTLVSGKKTLKVWALP